MNVNNFKDYINQTIIDRGYNYYVDGNVVATKKHGDNEYFFQVEGSENYEVFVEIEQDGEILYSECDCPYDFGPICKHEVAVFYTLIDILKVEESPNPKLRKKVNKQPNIAEILSNLSKEELVNIVLDITENDEILKNSLIIRYSKENEQQALGKCSKLIDSIIRKYTGRDGFIKYHETFEFIREMEYLLDKIKKTQDTFLALDIAFLLLKAAIDAFQYADDSGGNIGSFVSHTLEVIGETANGHDNKDIQQREKIFDKIFEQLDNDVFEGWEDYKIELLKICADFADIDVLRQKLVMKIESLIERNSSNRYFTYYNEGMLQIQLDIVEKYGSEEESEQFIHEHLQFSSFRERLINKFILSKNYTKVIELAQEGEKQDKQYTGLLSKWKKYRYIAYKELSLKKEQGRLGKELLLEGNFEYYKDLKVLVEESQDIFYANLKEELKHKEGWHARTVYLTLIEEENDLAEIMEYVRNNPRDIEKYAEKLLHMYKDGVVEIYESYIKTLAGSSSNCRDYQKVCGKIKRYKKMAGKLNQEQLINELSVIYRRKPAFVEELGKIK